MSTRIVDVKAAKVGLKVGRNLLDKLFQHCLAEHTGRKSEVYWEHILEQLTSIKQGMDVALKDLGVVENLQPAWGFSKGAMVIVKLTDKTPENIRKVLASLKPLNIELKSLTRSRCIETFVGLPMPERGNRTLGEFVRFLRLRLQKAGATGYPYIEEWKTA